MRGFLEPCGCIDDMRGGVARRATFLRESQSDGDLRVELGNLVGVRGPLSRLQLEYVLAALTAMDYDIVVPGAGDLRNGREFVEVASEYPELRFVCANVIDEMSNEPVFEPMYSHAVPNGTTIVIVGLVEADAGVLSPLRVTPPGEALDRIVAAPGVDSRSVVVLGSLSGATALRLAERHPDVRVVVGSRVPSGTDGVLQRGGAPVVLAGERGQYVSIVSVPHAGGAVSARRTWLDDSLHSDADLLDLVRRYALEAEGVQPAAIEAHVARLRSDGWVGSATCKECHAAEHAAWKRTKHAHAVRSLQQKDAVSRSECLACHLREDPVADALEADLGLTRFGVGCEACHGGAITHIDDVRSRDETDTTRPTATRAETACATCHDSANSPSFDEVEYRKRLAHPAWREEEDD